MEAPNLQNNNSSNGNSTKEVPKQEWEVAQNAIHQMEVLYVRPTPENYSIWYNYFSRVNPELAHEIDHRLEKNLPFDDEFLRFLENKYLESVQSNPLVLARINDNAQKVEHTQVVLSDALSIITSIISDASEQNEAIQNKLDNIIQNKENHDISSILEAMVTVAKEMKKSTVGLKNKLEESRKDVEKLENRLNEISVEAEKDFLTGVYNRKSLEKYIEQLTSEARISNEPLSMLAIDIDHFKQFNDNFGHLIGDEVIKMTARLITDMVKGKDIVARFGGEEFFVLLPNTTIGGANIVAESIRQTIARKELKNRSTGETYGVIHVSIGVALFRPESDSSESWMKRADDALYRSKKSGRNCVTQEDLSK
jgi:diguanylate cyclase